MKVRFLLFSFVGLALTSCESDPVAQRQQRDLSQDLILKEKEIELQRLNNEKQKLQEQLRWMNQEIRMR